MSVPRRFEALEPLQGHGDAQERHSYTAECSARAAAPPVEVELGAWAPSSPPDVVAAGPSVVLAPLETVVSPDSPEVLVAVVVPTEVLRSEVVLGAAVDSELSEPLAVLPVAVGESDSVAK